MACWPQGEPANALSSGLLTSGERFCRKRNRWIGERSVSGGGRGSVTVCVAVGGTGRVASVGESRGGTGKEPQSVPRKRGAQRDCTLRSRRERGAWRGSVAHPARGGSCSSRGSEVCKVSRRSPRASPPVWLRDASRHRCQEGVAAGWPSPGEHGAWWFSPWGPHVKGTVVTAPTSCGRGDRGGRRREKDA